MTYEAAYGLWLQLQRVWLRTAALHEAGIAASRNDTSRFPGDWYDSQHIDRHEAAAAARRDGDDRQLLAIMRRKGMA